LKKHLQPILWASLAFSLISLISIFIFDSIVMPLTSGQYTSVVTLPQLEKKPLQFAQKELEELGLVLEIDTVKFNPKVPKDFVIEQTPIAGRQVKIGRKIHISLSSGAANAIVPNINGKATQEARQILRKLGFQNLKITRIASSTIAPNMVLFSTPAKDVEISTADTVKLVVSAGHSGSLLIPNLTGLQPSEAKRLLNSLGLKLGGTSYAPGGTLALPGTILRQSPRSSRYLPRGTHIHVTIAN
jgi:eukaryotic-like serine/threonine-protein kinase